MPDTSRNLSSRVAGIFQASNYSNWQMQVSGGPYPAASPQTLMVVSGAITLRDGRMPTMFTVGATVNVGSGAQAESVTITAVTNMPGLGLPLNSSSLSGNTANAHGQGDKIVSNSGGLFEACSDAVSLYPNGATVIIDGSCSATQAQINSARTVFPTLNIVVEGEEGGEALVPITASGAIDPHASTNYIITKAGVAAMTLAAPTVTTDDGKVITITSGTAFAHTITATGLLNTGSDNVNVATFAAFAGASVTLQAYQGKWNVLTSTGTTFS